MGWSILYVVCLTTNMLLAVGFYQRHDYFMVSYSAFFAVFSAICLTVHIFKEKQS